MEVGNAAHLVDAERIKVVAEIAGRDFLRAEINALAGHAINAVRNRSAEIIDDNALEIVIVLRTERVGAPSDAAAIGADAARARGDARIEDALTGVVYVDDAQIVYGSQYKRYQRTRDEKIGVSVRVRRLV